MPGDRTSRAAALHLGAVMIIHFALSCPHPQVLTLVREFAHGLGCRPVAEAAPARDAIRFELAGGAEELLHLLSYVALAATRTGVEVSAPLCQITYQEPHAAATTTLKLRLSDLSLERSG